jgi:hypothetical protein
VNSSTINGRATTTSRTTRGTKRRASRRVVSSQRVRTFPSRPSRISSVMRTIITLPAGPATNSISGIWRHPTE